MDYNIFHLFFRHCITFKVVSAESEMVNKEMTAPWKETKLRTILARYQTNDIFNADEFGLFYEVLPSKSLHFRGKRCSGGKHSKVQLTGMAVSNAFGEKIPMFVTGKSASPRCFKQVCKVPADIDLKRKHGWMGYFLRNGCMRSIVSSKCKEEGLL